MKGVLPINPLEKTEAYQSRVIIPSFELKRATLTKNSIKNQYAIAMDKFTKSNVRSSYEDFRNLIDNVTPNDYAYMKLSQDMASIGFFNLSELAISKMKDGAYIINTARGKLIDSEALIHGIEIGKLGGAALDVVEFENLCS